MNLEDFKDFLYGFYKDRTDSLAEHYFRAADKDKSGRINFKEFISGLSIVPLPSISNKSNIQFNLSSGFEVHSWFKNNKNSLKLIRPLLSLSAARK
jgi:hypothetical protein